MKSDWIDATIGVMAGTLVVVIILWMIWPQVMELFIFSLLAYAVEH